MLRLVSRIATAGPHQVDTYRNIDPHLEARGNRRPLR
jgi:hypothetical protein